MKKQEKREGFSREYENLPIVTDGCFSRQFQWEINSAGLNRVLLHNASLDVLLLLHLTTDAGHGRRGLEVGPAEAQTQAVAQRGRRGSLEPGPQFNASISA